jgi:hypothetical protein
VVLLSVAVYARWAVLEVIGEVVPVIAGGFDVGGYETLVEFL